MILILCILTSSFNLNNPSIYIGKDIIVKSTKWVRCVMEKTAQIAGEDWHKDTKYLSAISPKNVYDVPDYFKQPLHGFSYGGNCVFQALYQSVSMRHIMRLFQFNSFYREETMLKHLLDVDYKKNMKNMVIVDVGCGSGDSTVSCHTAYPDSRILGIDLSYPMIRLAKLRNPGTKFTRMNAARTRFCDNSVDIITSFAMFHEMPKEYSKLVLSEFERILDINGSILIWDQRITPFSSIQKDSNDPIEPFLDSYTNLDITKELEYFGFNVTEINEGMFKVWIAKK